MSPEQFEQNVFDQIFLKVVDSTYRDKRLYTFFPASGTEQDNADFERQRQALRKDTAGLVIAVDDRRRIDLEKFKSKKFIFKKLSELPESVEYQNWIKKYKKFAGAMSFSKIQFDPKKKNGKLIVDYSCGGKCGIDYLVLINKEKDKWLIKKVIRTGIS
jgi:hypothetical protein